MNDEMNEQKQYDSEGGRELSNGPQEVSLVKDSWQALGKFVSNQSN